MRDDEPGGAAAPEDDATRCPKCGEPRAGEACPKCGLVFARYDPERLDADRKSVV